MKLKALWLAIVGAIVASLFVAPLAHAQATDTDISNLRPTFQQMVTTLENGLATNDVAQERAAASTALATGNSLIASLANIQSTATTDETRSRASGLSAHIQAAVGSLQEVATASDSEVAGKLNQALGEAQEALNEVPTAQALPQTGIGAEIPVGMLAAVAGVVLLGAGIGLRRAAVRA